MWPPLIIMRLCSTITASWEREMVELRKNDSEKFSSQHPRFTSEKQIFQELQWLARQQTAGRVGINIRPDFQSMSPT